LYSRGWIIGAGSVCAGVGLVHIDGDGDGAGHGFVVLAVLDREEGGKERLAEIGYALKSIFTRSDLIGEGPSS
jgi:hypothetical protein